MTTIRSKNKKPDLGKLGREAVIVLITTVIALGLLWAAVELNYDVQRFALLLFLTAIASLFTSALLIKYVTVRVMGQQVGAIYNRWTDTYIGFKPPGIHRLSLLTEKVKGYISTRVQSTTVQFEGQLAGAQPVSADIRITYRIEPFNINPRYERDMARTFAEGNDKKLVEGFSSNCFHPFFQGCDPEHLYDQGALDLLQNDLTNKVATMLNPFGVSVYRVAVRNIRTSPAVEEAVKRLQELGLQAELRSREQTVTEQLRTQAAQTDADIQQIHNDVALHHRASHLGLYTTLTEAGVQNYVALELIEALKQRGFPLNFDGSGSISSVVGFLATILMQKVANTTTPSSDSVEPWEDAIFDSFQDEHGVSAD